VEKNNHMLNPATIRNILTLRYDPTLTSILPQKKWADFTGQPVQPSVEFIEKSITDHIRNKIDDSYNGKIAIALSGGIDSTLILTILQKKFADLPIETISIKFADSVDETNRAAKISDFFGIKHHIVYLENYLKELPKAISIIKLPFWDLHWYYVVKRAQIISKYLVSGDGGDELFGGYTFRYKNFLSLINSNSKPLEKVKAYLQCHERDRVPDQENLFSTKIGFSWNLIYEILLPYFDNPLNSLEQVFLADYNGKLLYNFSIVNEAFHKYHNIISISPLLSEKLISYSFHLSSEHKYDLSTNIGKLLLRKILQKYRVESFVTDEKLGFNVNTINLWKSFGQNLCNDYLLKSRIVEDGWINKKWIEKYINIPELDIRYINKFLGLLAFEVWYRLFITKEMDSTTTLN